LQEEKSSGQCQTPNQQNKKTLQTAMIDDMAQIHDADAQISSFVIRIAVFVLASVSAGTVERGSGDKVMIRS